MKKNSIFILLLVLSISMTSCYYRPNTPVGSFARGGDVSWLSEMEHDSVRFYDAEGKEITINTGKTYVALVPDDDWADLVIE